MVSCKTAGFAQFVVLGSALVVAGCGGTSARPLTAGPIVNQTALEPSAMPSFPYLAPGQSVTIVFVERTCHYQQYTSDASRGQYAQLGCDNPVPPPALTVTISPMANGKPCALTYTKAAPNAVVFTKTGPGDPASGAPPNFSCHAVVTDPRLDPRYATVDFFL